MSVQYTHVQNTCSIRYLRHSFSQLLFGHSFFKFSQTRPSPQISSSFGPAQHYVQNSGSSYADCIFKTLSSISKNQKNKINSYPPKANNGILEVPASQFFPFKNRRIINISNQSRTGILQLNTRCVQNSPLVKLLDLIIM